MKPIKADLRPLPLLAGAAVFPCLSVWLLVRLWIPLTGHVSGKLLGVGALLLSAALLLLWHRLELTRRLLLPWGLSWKTALAAGIAFCLGGFFDLSYVMVDATGTLLSPAPVRLLCHLGSGILLAVIVLACLTAVKSLTGLGFISPWQLLTLFLLANGLTAIYLFSSRTVYVWDVAGYWSVARDLSRQPLGVAQLREVLATTLTLDYNHLLAWPISLLMRLLGDSRLVYLFAITNLYTLPGLWGMAALAQDKKWGGLTLAALLPMFVYVGLTGFVDTAAASLAIWAYVIYTSDRPPLERGILSGALLVGTFLLRRYFFFFAVTFGLAALLQKGLFYLLWGRKDPDSRQSWQDFAALFFSCGVCSVFFTYTFLLEKVLGTRYGALYSAYGLGLKTDFFIFFRYFGIILPLVSLLSLRKVSPQRRQGLLLALCQLPVCFLLFVAVQTHGQQHLLLYLPALAVLAAQLAPRPSRVLAAVTLVLCLIPRPQPASIQEIAGPAPLPSFHFYGPRREDVDQLLALARCVDALSAQEPKTATVLASSFILNSETISNLYPSLNLPEPEKRTGLYYHGTVDKRDGFNWNTAFADYLIIGDPVQTHLGEENQQVMALLAHQVLDGTGAGAAYSPLPETFTLEKGVTVRIYRRERDWTYEEFRSISEPLMALYPDYASIYALPEFITPD